jgi:hypothetical protein
MTAIEVRGSKEARRALDRMAHGAGKTSRETLEQAGRETLEKVKARTPVKTGRLARGHRMKMLDEKLLLLFNEVEYAGAVEFGRSGSQPKPHWRPALESEKRGLPKRYAKTLQKNDK